PDSVGNLHALMHLDLRENQLTSLPDSLRDLSSLEKLDLRWNGLPDPPAWLDVLRARGCMVYT
ncbi:MAG: leucine-rich repeat domain-containing protein, partial [Gemmatimonadota bacterium]|nr:leucine-rich repeat domain-containing protein [Gemmatimonadota bacterium]